MTPIIFCLAVFTVSLVAGGLGAVLGLGGGIIVVPALTLFFGLDIRYAVGASIISVIATSSGAASAYVRQGLTNMRVAMLLELGTTAGALCGAFLAGVINPRWLFVIFGLMLGYSSLAMLRGRASDAGQVVPADAWSDALQLHASYWDAAEQGRVHYQVTRAPLGLGLMFVAGLVSGLLGIGSGSLKVPAMDLAMNLPLKVSSATSNFMIGVTAAASAAVYFGRGDINPFIAGPVAAGVLLGALVGARVLPRLENRQLRVLFVLLLLLISGQMLFKGVHGA